MKKKGIKLITTNQLRFEFDIVLKALKNNNSLTLTYRNKPIAVIEPIISNDLEWDLDDPFFKLAGLAEEAGSLTSREIDQELYG